MNPTILGSAGAAIVTLAACYVGTRLAKREAKKAAQAAFRDHELARLRWSVDWGYSLMRDPNTLKITLVSRALTDDIEDRKVIVRYRTKHSDTWDIEHEVNLSLEFEKQVISIDSASYHVSPGEQDAIEVRISRASDDERIWQWFVPYVIPTASEFAVSPQPLISEVNWI